MTNNIVGVLAGCTVDHLLIDVPLHVTLCYPGINGRVICAVGEGNISLDDVLRAWGNSQRPCRLCAKKLKKRQAGEA